MCAVVFLALTAGLIGAASAQAQVKAPTGKQTCGTVTGAHWSIRGSGSGTHYTVLSSGLPCSLPLKSVRGLTRQANHGIGSALKGPSGLKCKSYASTASGDKLAYAGLCTRGTSGFGWTVKK